MKRFLIAIAALAPTVPALLVADPERAPQQTPAPTAVAAQGGITVNPYQVKVVREPGIEGLEVFDEPGIEIKVAIQVPGKPLLEVVDDRCTVRRFVDDAGTDLAPGLEAGFFHWAQLDSRWGDDPDMTIASLTLTAGSLPSPKAGRLELDATVVMLSASDLDTDEVALEFKKGVKFELAGIPFTISDVEDVEDGWGDAVQQITLETNTALDAIQKFTLLGPDGAEVGCDEMGTTTMSFGERVTIRKDIGPHVKLASGTLRVSYYRTLEEVEVPLALDLGVGF
ncbi:hypothetical protein [Planctomycetes bacterium Pla163]